VLQDALDTAEDPLNAEALRDLLRHLDSGELKELTSA